MGGETQRRNKEGIIHNRSLRVHYVVVVVFLEGFLFFVFFLKGILTRRERSSLTDFFKAKQIK